MRLDCEIDLWANQDLAILAQILANVIRQLRHVTMQLPRRLRRGNRLGSVTVAAQVGLVVGKGQTHAVPQTKRCRERERERERERDRGSEWGARDAERRREYRRRRE